MLAKDYFWTEATQAFSEEIEHSKQIGLSPEEKTFLTYLSDFYLDSADQLHKYTHPNSEEWTTCYADGSFHVLSLEKFIKENYRFFSKEQMVEMYIDYKLQAAQQIKDRSEKRERLKIASQK